VTLQRSFFQSLLFPFRPLFLESLGQPVLQSGQCLGQCAAPVVLEDRHAVVHRPDQYCIFTSSMCSSSSLASYSFRFSLPSCGGWSEDSIFAAADFSFLPTVVSLTLPDLVEELPGAPRWPCATTRSILPSSPHRRRFLAVHPAAIFTSVLDSHVSPPPTVFRFSVGPSATKRML